LRRDLGRSLAATLIVVLTIVITMFLIRTLGQAAGGAIAPQDVVLLLGYISLEHLPPILTLSLFIAIVGTLSRMYRDSEMVIWFAAGRGLSALVRPLLMFAWPVLLVVALLGLVGWPWANQQIGALKDRYGNRGDLERVSPGQFQESASGTRVFFLDKDSPDNKSGRNVFIATSEKGRETVTSALEGQVVTQGDSQFLLLSNGQRMERRADRPGELKVTEFEELGNRVGAAALANGGDAPSRAVDTLKLLRERTPLYMGELSWRIGLGLCALNFTLLALPLSAVNPRRGRSYQYGVALLAFVFYYNLLNIGQNWIASGRYSLPGLLLVLHGGVLLLALGWLWVQHRQWSWRHLWPAQSPGAQP